MPVQSITFSANEIRPEKSLQNVSQKINEWARANPDAMIISVSHSFSPEILQRVMAHALVVYSTK